MRPKQLSCRLWENNSESTCNIGIIRGGRARNIVPDEVVVEGEVRSICDDKLKQLTDQLTASFRETVEREGGSVEIEVENTYGGFSIPPNHPILQMLEKATNNLNIPMNLILLVGEAIRTLSMAKEFPQ